MKKLLPVAGLLFLMLLVGSALADSWLPPSVQQYTSADGNWRLTIYPRPLTSQLNYFSDKVDGKRDAGGVPGDTQKSPVGHMEHRRDGRWETVWKTSLVNDVSPVEAVVSNTGESATLDNWHSMGWGEDAVVVYATDGTQVRKFGLADFLPKYYIDALPHSVSSIQWRGAARVDEANRQLIIPVVVPSANASDAYTEKGQQVDARFHLSDGSLLPMDGKDWGEALAAALEVNTRNEQWLAEQRTRFISPLAAPTGNDVKPWYDYLIEAFFRIDPEWDGGYPDTNVVPLPSASNFRLLAGYVGDSLTEDMNADGAIMVAALSQEVLVDTVAKQARRVKSGSLTKARVYVAADNAHMPAIRAALALTGAKVIQLDVHATIPQREERLERYLSRNKEAGE